MTLLAATSSGSALPAPAGATAAADAGATRATTIRYGDRSGQDMDFWPSATRAGSPAPLVLFVHGGAWKSGDRKAATGRYKTANFTREGYAFASIDYRLVPDATVEQQAQDVADALAALLKQADRLGIARGKVVLMGHSAGAHLVALVGTDPRYLQKAGLSFADLRGIVAIDGAAYDVPRQMAEGTPVMQDIYNQVFGTDPVRQRTLSPTVQAATPNAPAFLLLHVRRADGIRQAEALEAALGKAGTPVQRDAFAGRGIRGHMTINRELGNPDHPATPVLDRWLDRVLR